MRSYLRLIGVLLALILCGGLGVLTARPSLSDSQQRALAATFGFTPLDLNAVPANARTLRPVAPALERFRSWINAVGAAVALTDLRGLGRPADACLVDPRDDSVTLRSVPGSATGDYGVVTLRPAGLPYDGTMAPQGCVPADLDEDGDIDLTVYYWGRSPVLFLNTTGPAATPQASGFRAVELVTPMQVWNSTALNVGDLDGDGHLDVVVANYFPDGARVLDPRASDETRMQMQDGMGKARNAGVNRVLLTHPTGQPDTLPELADASNGMPDDAARAWTLAIGLQDLTGDLLPEVYLANDFGQDDLLVNRSTPGQLRLQKVVGQRSWTMPKSKVLGRDSFKGMGITFTYGDGADLPTLVVSNITQPFGLQESNFAFVPTGPGRDLLAGRLPYRNDSERLGLSRSGWSWDIKAGDFDNDGVDEFVQAAGFLRGTRNRWPLLQELAIGNDNLVHDPRFWPVFAPGDDLAGHDPDLFWARGPGGRYVNLAKNLGLDDASNSRGVAIGDVDGDGRLDVVVANQWRDALLLQNRATGGRPAADLDLVRPGAAGGFEPAIGAQVDLPDPVCPQKAQLYPTNGHAGVSGAELHLVLRSAALGEAGVPATVSWVDEHGAHRAGILIRPGHHIVELHGDGTAVVR